MILPLCFTLFTTPTLLAQNQLQVLVNVSPPYSPYLQDYPGDGQRVRVTLINTSGQTLQVRFLGSVVGDNGVSIKTLPNYRPIVPLTVPPGTKPLTRSDLEGLFDLNQIVVEGFDKNTLYRGAALPEGNYQLCVQAFDNRTSQALSAQFPLGCSNFFTLKSVEPPILISPLCDGDVTPTTPQAVVFTWTPPAGVSPASVDYTLRIVELPQGDVDPNVFIDQVVLPKTGLEVRNLRTSTYLYGPTAPPLTVGKRYAWRVQAIDRSGKLNFQNDGKSPVCAFTHGTPDSMGDKKPANAVFYSEKIQATCSCKQPVSNNAVNNKPALEAGKATVAGFPLTFLKTADGVIETDGVLTGHGTIPMPIVNNSYAKLRVELVNVQCNAAGEVISGYVQAIRSGDFPKIYPNVSKPALSPPGVPAISTANADSVGNQIQKLGEQIKNMPGHLLNQAGEVAKSVGMEVPFGIDKTIGPIKTVISITDVIFTPEDAYFNANTFIEAPGLSVQFNGIPLAAYHVCIKPDGTCGDKIMYLAADMPASSLLTLKGGAVSFEALKKGVTNVVFDADGFKTLHIAAGLKPPGLHRANEPNVGDPLEMLVSTDLDTPDFNNWSASVSFDDFYVGGLKDYVFSMTGPNGQTTPGTYDNSEKANPDGFPMDYTDLGNLWKGIYFPLMQVKLSGPFAKLNKQGKPLTGGVQHMIHDAQNGFSGKLFLKNILTLGEGEMKSWGVSIDEISGTFQKSDFKEARMLGRVGLPLFKKDDGTASALSYTAAIANNPGSTDLTFNIQPTDNMHVAVWRADLQLNSDSHIGVNYVAGNFSAKALFNGKLDLDLSITKVTAAQFEGLGVMTDAPYFAMQNVSFNSPQRYIGGVGDDGFPLTLTSFSVVNPAGILTPAPAIARDLAFTGNLNLTEAASFSASATARVRFTVGPTWASWGYKDYFIDSLSAHGHIGPATIDATIGFLHDDPTWGNGFAGRATLDVGLAGAVQVQATFGRTLGNAGFRYYYVSGVVPLGPTGIPLGSTGLNLKSFRGGLYSHIAQTIKDDKVSYAPSNSVTFGIQAGVIIGTPGTNMLNLDGTLTFEFGDSWNVAKVAIDANAYLLTKGTPPIYQNPMATGLGHIEVDIANGIFSGYFDLKAQQSLADFTVQATADAEIYFEPKGLKFYLAFGNPNGKRVDMSLIASGKTLLSLDSYFLMGTYVPSEVFGTLPPPLSTNIISPELLGRLNYHPNPFQGSPNGAALAFGSSFNIGKPTDQVEVDFGPFYFSFYLGAGYDFVLQQVESCQAYPSPGFNGWYATGQVYAGLGFSLGVDVDLWFISGKVEVAGGDAAALLQGGMVNPVWLQGSVAIRYRALRGLIKGTCSAHVEYNTDKICILNPPPVNPFGNPLIASLQPNGDNDLNVISPFYAEFNYPIETNIDVDSLDAKGVFQKTLTFRVVYQAGQQFTAMAAAGGSAAQYKNCLGDNSGRLRYGVSDEGDVNTAATFYRNSAMAPESDYEMTLGLVATRRESDGKFHPFYFKGKLIDTTAVAKFHTGKCNSVMTREGNNKTVSYSYPFEGQRYFMKGDATTGFVEFVAKSCCLDGLTSNEDFALKVRITPGFNGEFSDKKALLADATYDGEHVKYKVPPGLVNSQLYKLEIVKIPTPAYIAKQEAVLDELKKKAKQQVGSQNVYALVGSVVAASNTVYDGKIAGLDAKATSFNGAGMPKQPGGSSGGVAVQPGNTGTGFGHTPGVGLGASGQAVNAKADRVIEQYANNLTDDGGLVQYDQRKSGKSDKLIKTSKAQQDYDVGKQLEQVLYSYYFQTSKYNTLVDKLKDVFLNPFAQKTETMLSIVPLPDAVFTLPMGNPSENFDRYELQVADLGYAKYLPPLVNFRANTSQNTWYSTYMKPMLKLMQVSNYSGGGWASYLTTNAAANTDVDLLERQMVSVSGAFDVPEAPIGASEVDNALLASEAYYQTDQSTGKDVLFGAATAATVNKGGKQRYGVSLTALPFWAMYQQKLVPNVDQFLNLNRKNFKMDAFSLYAQMLAVLGPLCQNANMSDDWQKAFYSDLYKQLQTLNLGQTPDQLKYPITNLITQAADFANNQFNLGYDAPWSGNGTNSNANTTPKKNTYAYPGFSTDAGNKCYAVFLDLYLTVIKSFWNDATTQALQQVKDGKYIPLGNQHNSVAQFDIWALSPEQVAQFSLWSSSGVSDFFWDFTNNCPSAPGYTFMKNINRPGFLFIK